ncbi:hypothetical protein [Nocardioides flavescens]|uniref:Uncharacterized protein n=1 Tax=Nocardioides flavescens TaxID=2691959 RepID=A0A6L7EXU9_9ACTN|nr:hypothetical protein [Nocardioides flavescens]MXG89155.1 hypothetical protein [Nocardioides flavescens]
MSGRDDAHDTEPDPGQDSGPSLEAPSLFGRKRRRKPAAAPQPDPQPEPQPGPEPTALTRPEPERTPEPEPVPEPTVEVTQPQPVVAAPAPVRPPVPRAEPARVPEEKAPRSRSLQLPQVPGLTGRRVVAVIGAVVGLLVVLATLAAQGLCSVVRGTSSCGGGGFFLLVAILVVAAVAGGALLRAVGEPEPGSTAVLAVALLSVVTLLFLAGQLFEWWMAIAIPLVSVVMFLVSHWVTTTYADSSDRA